MKNGTLKDKHLEIFSYLISAALIAAVCIGGSAEKLSVAMASFMFYPGKPETTAVSETTVTQTEPVTVVTTQKPTQLTAEEAEKARRMNDE